VNGAAWAWFAAFALPACGAATPAPGLSALPTGSPAEVLATCEQEPYAELAVGCRVEAAAQAAAAGDLATVAAACRDVPAGKWQDECHFRAGEQLGRAGRTDDALAQCAVAGRFDRFCLTHAGWGLPPDDARTPDALAELARRTIPGRLGDDAAEVLRARAWFNRYVGVGRCDPALAKTAHGPDGPPARTAWAIEAVRLAGGFDAAREAWASDRVLTGDALAPADRVGLYEVFPDFPGEAELPHVRTFADASRFVGETDEEDVDIALIEAVYFHARPGPDAGAVFSRWLHDPRPRVRYTALRRYRSVPSSGVEAQLRALASDPDPIVVEHALDGLKYTTWLGKQH